MCLSLNENNLATFYCCLILLVSEAKVKQKQVFISLNRKLIWNNSFIVSNQLSFSGIMVFQILHNYETTMITIKEFLQVC